MHKQAFLSPLPPPRSLQHLGYLVTKRKLEEEDSFEDWVNKESVRGWLREHALRGWVIRAGCASCTGLGDKGWVVLAAQDWGTGRPILSV